MMNHPHHHHPHHHHHPPPHHHHAHAGVAIGPLPNQCIGMVAAPTAGGPVLAGIGVPIMTAAAPTLVAPPPMPQTPHNHNHNQLQSGAQHLGGNIPNKLVMSPDSSVDDKEKCPAHPFMQARTSPSGATVVVSCAGGPGQGSGLTWTTATGATGTLMPAGIAYPVMGLPQDHTGAGMIYGVSIAAPPPPPPPPEHQVSPGVNSLLSLPTSTPNVVQPQPPTAISMSSVIPTQNNTGVVGSTTISPLGGAANASAAAAAVAMVQQQQQHQQNQPSNTPTSCASSLSSSATAEFTAAQQQPTKEIIHCKSCTLFPPNPNAPPPTTREKPPGCRTAFVGGLPENIREDLVREIFERCGEITTIRMSKKNFCHIRFEMEQFVELALYLSGYRIRIGSNSDSANIGRLHVDYAQARDDLYEWECRQRQLLREQRHRERLEQERLQPPSPPPAVHYSDHEAANVAERIKGDDTFMKAIQIVFSWLEKGDCAKRNSNTFYSMIQSTNSQVRRLINEKSQYDEEFQKAKDLFRQRMTGLLMQFTQIEKVFSAACQRKVWDHFSKAQRKNIEVWKKQATEIKSALLEEALNERADEEMEFSDLESDASGQSNKENGEPPRAKKMRLSVEDAAKTVHQLKEENDALRCQLEASKNEVDLIKADLRTELEMKDQQLRSLQQQVLAVQRTVASAPSSVLTTACPSSSSGNSGSGTNVNVDNNGGSISNGDSCSSLITSPPGNHAHTLATAVTGGATLSSVAASSAAVKQNLHSPPVSVSSSSSPGIGRSPSGGGNSGSTNAPAVNGSLGGIENDSGEKMKSVNDASNGEPNNKTGNNREFQGFCDSSSSNGVGGGNSIRSVQQSAQNNQHNQSSSTSSNNNGSNNSNGNSNIASAIPPRSLASDNKSNDDPHHHLSETFMGTSPGGVSGYGNNSTSGTSSSNSSSSSSNAANNNGPDIVGICEKEARLLGIISTFLHVHPFGASLDYIWSYAQCICPMVRPNQIEVLMTKFPSLFKQEISGIGATFERKWVFVGFS